jgi:hypothetical protein
MRVSIRGLDTGFIYPCTKREVIEALSKGVVDYVSFQPKFGWNESSNGGMKQPFKGHVLASISISNLRDFGKGTSASLHIYRVRQSEFSEHLGHQLVRNLKHVMRQWAESKFEEVEADQIRHAQLIAGFNAGGLFLYQVTRLANRPEVNVLTAVS